MAEAIPRHISDVETWGKPDRNYFVFVIISVLFGFFGVDHMYLRSYKTGLLKFCMNIVTLGLWYFWDLIQIAKDGDQARKEGLRSPFDWILGIGRGTFQQVGGVCGPEYGSPKSYILYTFLAVCFGWLGADKFYLGEVWQGLAKVFSCFNIFIFMFGWLWVAWDAFHAVFMTGNILEKNISAPLPYSIIFNTPTDAKVFRVREMPKEEAPMGWMDWIAKVLHFPNVPNFSWEKVIKDTLDIVRTPNLIKALAIVNSGQMPEISEAPSAPPAVPSAPPAVPSAAPRVGGAYKLLHQSGGGRGDIFGKGELSDGPGPVIAGVLTAIVLAGGFKGFYDVICKQYG